MCLDYVPHITQNLVSALDAVLISVNPLHCGPVLQESFNVSGLDLEVFDFVLADVHMPNGIWEKKSMSFAVEVWGNYAMFTRPEFKVERYSYDVMTPSAAIGFLKAIYWDRSFLPAENSGWGVVSYLPTDTKSLTWDLFQRAEVKGSVC